MRDWIYKWTIVSPYIEIELWSANCPKHHSFIYSNQFRKPACYETRLLRIPPAMSTNNLCIQAMTCVTIGPKSPELDWWLTGSFSFVLASNLEPTRGGQRCTPNLKPWDDLLDVSVPTVTPCQQSSVKEDLKPSLSY